MLDGYRQTSSAGAHGSAGDRAEITVEVDVVVPAVIRSCEEIHHSEAQALVGKARPLLLPSVDLVPSVASANMNMFMPHLVGFMGRYCLKLRRPLKPTTASSTESSR